MSTLEAAKVEVIIAGGYPGRGQCHVGRAGNAGTRVSLDLLICARTGAAMKALLEREKDVNDVRLIISVKIKPIIVTFESIGFSV